MITFGIIWLVSALLSILVENLYFPFKQFKSLFDTFMIIVVTIIGGPILLFYMISVYYMSFGAPSEKDQNEGWYTSFGLFH